MADRITSDAGDLFDSIPEHLFRSSFAGEIIMSIDSAEVFYLDITAWGACREIDELSKLICKPEYAEHLARKSTVEELERAEAVLSRVITNLRARVAVTKYDAIIIDLTARLRK